MKKALPLYQKIEQDLRQRITDGTWSSGVMLPSRQSLAREFESDLTTLQRAIQPLLEEGLLIAEKGRGTFVASEFAPTTMPALPRSQAPTIGIVCPINPEAQMKSIWENEVIRAIERAVLEDGGTTVFLSSDAMEGLPEAISVRGIDALVFIDLNSTILSADSDTSLLSSLPVPLSVITYHPLSYPIPHLLYDQFTAGYLAAEHLLQQGWERLVFIQPFSTDWVEDRAAGACEAVRRRGEIPLERWQRPPGYFGDSWESGMEVGGAFLESLGPNRGIGIIAPNDKMGVGVLQVAAERGWRVGYDLGVVSFDDTVEARVAELSSFRPPLEELGTEAARHLLRALSGQPLAFQTRFVSHLISRLSSRRYTRT
jgi:DNA-binding LacI/PurR family transcriptional regulator